MKLKIILFVGFLLNFGLVQNLNAQLNYYPNEIKRFRFFNTGKLNKLKLTETTREEVIKIFGESCENSCVYNDKWNFSLSFFYNITKSSGLDNTNILYFPKPEYIDKLFSIIIYPQINIRLEKNSFNHKFQKGNGGFGGTDEYGEINGTLDVFYDEFGLKYKILRTINSTNKKVLLLKRKGGLDSIEYTIPDKLEDDMFIEQKLK